MVRRQPAAVGATIVQNRVSMSGDQRCWLDAKTATLSFAMPTRSASP
jgi:hypothetical protein